MVGPNVPVLLSNFKWKLAKNVKKHDILINTSGVPSPVKSVDTKVQKAVNLKLDSLPFNLTFGVGCPLEFRNSHRFFKFEGLDYVQAVDCSGKVDLTPDYFKYGDMDFKEYSYHAGYVLSFLNTKKQSSRYNLHLRSLNDDVLSVINCVKNKFEFLRMNSNLSFYVGFADGLKDGFTDLRRVSTITDISEINYIYNLGGNTLLWPQSITDSGKKVKSYVSSLCEVSHIKQEVELVNIDCEGGFIAGGFKVVNE